MSFPTDSSSDFILFMILLLPVCALFYGGLELIFQIIVWILSIIFGGG